jgi:hypothetical protein
MSIFTSLRKIMQSITETIQRVVTYISGAATRIFRPTDDEYPPTGVQPFEGDSAEKKHF